LSTAPGSSRLAKLNLGHGIYALPYANTPPTLAITGAAEPESNVLPAAAVGQPWTASLQAADELLARTDAVVDERRRVTAALTELGYTVPDSQANFVWLPLAERTSDFAAQAAEQARVLVRPYGNEGARVSIGSTEENDAFLTFARSWIRH
jgi:histidinol-phosphate/aromatic aminotransferase/cobyric acid decarboxylase-like protein